MSVLLQVFPEPSSFALSTSLCVDIPYLLVVSFTVLVWELRLLSHSYSQSLFLGRRPDSLSLLKMTSNSKQSSHFIPPTTGIIGMRHHPHLHSADFLSPLPPSLNFPPSTLGHKYSKIIDILVQIAFRLGRNKIPG